MSLKNQAIEAYKAKLEKSKVEALNTKKKIFNEISKIIPGLSFRNGEVEIEGYIFELIYDAHFCPSRPALSLGWGNYYYTLEDLGSFFLNEENKMKLF